MYLVTEDTLARMAVCFNFDRDWCCHLDFTSEFAAEFGVGKATVSHVSGFLICKTGMVLCRLMNKVVC
jgi:hypothetical protein